jgi:hypothetical protein
MFQHPLDYQSPKKRKKPSVPYSRSMAGAAVGVVATVPAILLGMPTPSMAHVGGGTSLGSYIVYPVQSLLPGLYSSCTAMVILAAMLLCQYPLYGLAIGWCSGVSRKACIRAIAAIAGIHLFAVALCLRWQP